MHYSRDINLYAPLDLDSICVLPLSPTRHCATLRILLTLSIPSIPSSLLCIYTSLSPSPHCSISIYTAAGSFLLVKTHHDIR